jgi:CARDB
MRRLLMTCGAVAGMLAAQLALPANAAPAFNLTLTASPVTYVGACPAKIALEGKIVNLPDYVPSAQYSLLNSDGIDSFPMTATFDASHTFLVHDGRTPSASGAYWVQLLIHSGGQVVAKSDRANFTVRCTNGATPNPNMTPPSYATPTPKPAPCRPVATHVVRCPDLTARPPVSVGGHATVWGAGVTLTDADALPGPLPKCAFNIRYTIANIGTANAGPLAYPLFKNVLRVDGNPVSIQTALSQAAGTSRTILTQAYLPKGVHQLTLDVDDGNVIPESNEANNHFAIKYQLTGKCTNT